MEQKRDLVRTYNSQGLKLEQALEIIDMAKSTYYFKRKHTRSGRRKTTQTLFKGFVVDDSFVVACIKEIISKDYIDYGYKKCTVNLCRLGFEIGDKKVYRLMDESNLLNPPKKSKSGRFDKEIVKNKPNPNGPLEIIELDIKYMYIEGEGRHAYLVTLLDVFHREVYGWHLGYSMRASIVVNLILDFIDKELINAEDRAKKIELSFRSDNGSQFISKNYKKLMKKFNLKAVYIPPATPQLNGHIESYHSIVQKEVCDKNEFKNIEACITEMKNFIETYNQKRYMTVLLNLPPKPFLKLWEQGHIGKKEVKRKQIFFFKEENKKRQNELANTVLQPMLVDLLSSIEVNLKNNQDFCVSQIKDIVNLPKQIYAN